MPALGNMLKKLALAPRSDEGERVTERIVGVTSYRRTRIRAGYIILHLAPSWCLTAYRKGSINIGLD